MLDWHSTTVQEARFVVSSQVPGEMCTEEEQVKVHVPSASAFLFPGSFVWNS